MLGLPRAQGEDVLTGQWVTAQNPPRAHAVHTQPRSAQEAGLSFRPSRDLWAPPAWPRVYAVRLSC